MRFRIPILLSLFLSAVAVFAQESTPYSITPNSGPVAGGTQVTIKGDFGFWPYAILFGTAGVPATRVDDHTLVATTPAHPAGTVPVTIFEYDIGLATDLTFTFTGPSGTRFERVLLPIFTPPVQGAFGSEFHTEVEVWNPQSTGVVTLFGAETDSSVDIDPSVALIPDGKTTLSRAPQHFNGNPGHFLYVAEGDFDLIGATLRVHDVTREATSFGTEIPIVREREFSPSQTIAFPHVPIDPRFRNTLRIYSTEATTVTVKVGAQTFGVTLQPGRDMYEPAYAAFTNFPNDGIGATTVTVEPTFIPVDPPLPGTNVPVWAFISVTNNDTQQITTITPQR
ncbi:MAG: IPT/TIG domain-containing protein [Acidobacteria bacterium]|nr:IPT/TIG domain-containing protein [Acidobacteriota bacterium]MBV9475289.1 IPT/TIG domain-containing protein [Acidobacteriota bacterium]